MELNKALSLLASVALLTFGLSGAEAQDSARASNMTFFVTSVGSGKGADLGGLAGADRHCQSLASAVGAGNRTWRAYLSASATAGELAANARDRIGRGPWANAKGEIVARDLDELHANNNIAKQTAITEKGDVVSGRGDPVNMHDMLTGSQRDGRAFAGSQDMTCGNWTKSGDDGSAMLGHHDRTGTDPDLAAAQSWNSSHPSRGCSPEGLRSTGGNGLFYCFAAD